MLERLRQAAFMVNDLKEAEDLYRDTLGMESCRSEELTMTWSTSEGALVDSIAISYPLGVGRIADAPRIRNGEFVRRR